MKKFWYVTASVKINDVWEFNIVNQIVFARSLDEAELFFKTSLVFIQRELDERNMKVRIMSVMDVPLTGKQEPTVNNYGVPYPQRPKDMHLKNGKYY